MRDGVILYLTPSLWLWLLVSRILDSNFWYLRGLVGGLDGKKQGPHTLFLFILIGDFPFTIIETKLFFTFLPLLVQTDRMGSLLISLRQSWTTDSFPFKEPFCLWSSEEKLNLVSFLTETFLSKLTEKHKFQTTWTTHDVSDAKVAVPCCNG